MTECLRDPSELRKEFNSKIKRKYIDTHTPQCKKCMRFHKWGNNVMEVHHIKALIDGGTNDEENLVTLCCVCHAEWHQHQEYRMTFSEWMSKTPLHVYAAIGMSDDDQLKTEMFCHIDEMWPEVRDKRMVTEPWTDENKKYVEKNCANWVDW